jgi:SNF2 family DNA or RNA helicase
MILGLLTKLKQLCNHPIQFLGSEMNRGCNPSAREAPAL